MSEPDFAHNHVIAERLNLANGSGRIILVTGGFGFIGKHFIRRCLEAGHHIINVDRVNYAADRLVRAEFAKHPNYRVQEQDIAALDHLSECDVIVNFAAESHVDNSISDNTKFCLSNILGVQRLLELVRVKQPADRPRFIHISTDEVYGEALDGPHHETSILRPSNPYSATKAAADMLVMSWARTYHLDCNIVRPTNNYGPHQYPEKLIPKSCARLKRGRPALLHGNGSYVRCWLHVEDTVDAVLTVIEKGAANTIYNAGGVDYLQNIEIVRRLAQIIGVPETKAFGFTEDRLGQDRRYSIDSARLNALGWRPKRSFDKEIESIVEQSEFQRFL
ncbi:GDP-mannose 4,6-dehydratase [Bosea sp. BK604]|uniref:dTDP-glucose 4,6-dehydratase n=1 Tax=Bosea sp. BK604 TaxID=2512180 RepID=UPI0010E6DEFA|nr:GDP-mannose 4,6-dehydratase [Bosea sp. BK604]TCR70000.1 dTDP-glucose 4,6-dehydratase [Bosea sp. BK604]